jgi:hypothetical protein
VVTDHIIAWLCAAANWLASLLPDSDLGLPDGAVVAGYLDDLNYFLPIAETMTAVGAVILLGPAFLIATIAVWITVGIVRGGSPRA